MFARAPCLLSLPVVEVASEKMAQKFAKTVSFAYLSLVNPFFLRSYTALALPSPIRPRYGSEAPLLELYVDVETSLGPGNAVFSDVAGLSHCWSYSPFPSSGVAVPTDIQALQPTLTILIPAANDNVPQLVSQAVGPTNSAGVQANGGQGAQGQGGTDRKSEEETIRTTSAANIPQYGTL